MEKLLPIFVIMAVAFLAVSLTLGMKLSEKFVVSSEQIAICSNECQENDGLDNINIISTDYNILCECKNGAKFNLVKTYAEELLHIDGRND